MCYTIEPPGIFRGRGEHPRMGRWKRRLTAEDVVINCSRSVNIAVDTIVHSCMSREARKLVSRVSDQV